MTKCFVHMFSIGSELKCPPPCWPGHHASILSICGRCRWILPMQVGAASHAYAKCCPHLFSWVSCELVHALPFWARCSHGQALYIVVRFGDYAFCRTPYAKRERVDTLHGVVLVVIALVDPANAGACCKSHMDHCCPHVRLFFL
jgi:hypothetical protein